MITTYFLFDMEMDNRKWNSRYLLLGSFYQHLAPYCLLQQGNDTKWMWMGFCCTTFLAGDADGAQPLFYCHLRNCFAYYYFMYVLYAMLYVGWFHFSFFFFSLLFWFSCLPDYCLAFRNIGSDLEKLIPILTFFSIEEWCCEVVEEPCYLVLEIEKILK